MELIIIGSGTSALRSERGLSGYILKAGVEVFLLDGGSGTLLKCLQAGISYRDIDRIFYTHLHPDHTIDLVPFLFATKYTPGFSRKKPLSIFGPPGFRDFFDRFVGLFGKSMIEVDYEIEIGEVSPGRFKAGNCEVSSLPTMHTDNSLAYRFEDDGKSLVYSGDTDFCPEIIELSSGADLLLLECSFPDHMKVTGHLTPKECGRIANTAGVKHLVLTHLYPPCDETDIVAACRSVFSGQVTKAGDLMRFEI